MKQLTKISVEELKNIILNDEPKGKFYTFDENIFVGCDNTNGDLLIEEFKTEEGCVSWLLNRKENVPTLNTLLNTIAQNQIVMESIKNEIDRLIDETKEQRRLIQETIQYIAPSGRKQETR